MKCLEKDRAAATRQPAAWSATWSATWPTNQSKPAAFNALPPAKIHKAKSGRRILSLFVAANGAPFVHHVVALVNIRQERDRATAPNANRSRTSKTQQVAREMATAKR